VLGYSLDTCAYIRTTNQKNILSHAEPVAEGYQLTNERQGILRKRVVIRVAMIGKSAAALMNNLIDP